MKMLLVIEMVNEFFPLRRMNEASEQMFLSSDELSLLTSISVWSWPGTNLVLRRPKDLIHEETTQLLT